MPSYTMSRNDSLQTDGGLILRPAL